MNPLITRIGQANAGRDPERLALKYRAMAQNPFVFFRGTCHLFYQDWPQQSVLNGALLTGICGDLHLENFGSYKGDNRLTYFDMNDFDEAVLAPCSWELARFLTSVLIGVKTLGVKKDQAAVLCESFLSAYVAALADGKARWVERATAQGMVKSLLSGLKSRSREEFLNSRTVLRKGRRMLKLDGKHALPVSDADYQKVTLFMDGYARQRENPEFFKVLDVARRIAGTGSLGLERYVILVQGRGHPDGNFLLDLKHQSGSALAPYVLVPQPAWVNQAERVAKVQHWMQAISPAFFAPVVIGERAYTLRELLPSQDRLSLELWNGKLKRLESVMQTMGQAVAWAQLRSSGRQGASPIDALERFSADDAWRKPLLDYAQSYAVQVEKDWRVFSAAHPMPE
jgi:uncharacterized protein (DUF2252 family)